MDFLPRQLVADPTPLSRRIVHLPVAREREFERDPWSGRVSGGKKKRSIKLQRRGFLNGKVDLHTVIS